MDSTPPNSQHVAAWIASYTDDVCVTSDPFDNELRAAIAAHARMQAAACQSTSTIVQPDVGATPSPTVPTPDDRARQEVDGVVPWLMRAFMVAHRSSAKPGSDSFRYLLEEHLAQANRLHLTLGQVKTAYRRVTDNDPGPEALHLFQEEFFNAYCNEFQFDLQPFIEQQLGLDLAFRREDSPWEPKDQEQTGDQGRRRKKQRRTNQQGDREHQTTQQDDQVHSPLDYFPMFANRRGRRRSEVSW